MDVAGSGEHKILSRHAASSQTSDPEATISSGRGANLKTAIENGGMAISRLDDTITR